MTKIEYINQLTGETEVAMDIAGVNGAEIDWMKISDDKKGNLRLTVDEASEKREGYVLIFSEAAYEEIKNDLENKLIKTNEKGEPDFNDIYLDNNLLIHFVQKEKKQEAAQAFKLTYFNEGSMQEIACSKVTDPEIIKLYSDVNDIYTVEYPAAAIEIDPLLGDFEDDWNFKVMRNDTDITETGICEGGASATTISAWEEEVTQEFHILFIKDNEIKKVLIVTPNYN